jgi:hypothetical protein
MRFQQTLTARWAGSSARSRWSLDAARGSGAWDGYGDRERSGPAAWAHEEGGVAESPGLARFQGARLPLDTKCPKRELNQMIPSSTPNGRTRTFHVLRTRSNNEYKLTIVSPFHTTHSLRNSLLQYQRFRVRQIKQRK